jgi:hypothetical protein
MAAPNFLDRMQASIVAFQLQVTLGRRTNVILARHIDGKLIGGSQTVAGVTIENQGY